MHAGPQGPLLTKQGGADWHDTLHLSDQLHWVHDRGAVDDHSGARDSQACGYA